jgi:hypothetical protein
MGLNPRLVGRALALLCAISMWPVPSLLAYAPPEPRLVSVELDRLGTLNQALRRTLEREEARLESTCEFTVVRGRLIEVRDTAAAAIGRLGALWREGHLRNGGLALAELLVHELDGIVEEARRGIAVADTLALIQSHEGEVRDVVHRTAAVYPEALACIEARRDPAATGQARARTSK